ncbi:unnamed protein product [Paramecium primaurelia]|uniref:Peptidase S49 domain-containing protein n=1 Tax=Paramecium primaurelia TaxID=5886 RepID=A0A8S1KTY0_PARPR|nr:unnamed protein product [Paramecium primaurelia]
MNKFLKLIGKDTEKYKKVSYFFLQGQITSSMTYKVYKALKKFKPENSKAMALIINSTGGSLAHAHIIQRKFDLVRKRYNIPLYTFAEDYALSGAFYLLCMGDKIFCNKTSIVGAVGIQIQTLNILKLLEHYKLEVRTYNSGVNETFLQQIDPLNENTSTHILENISAQQNQQLQLQIRQMIGNRENKEVILNGSIYNGQQLFEDYKFSNGIGQYLNILAKEYPQNKLENATQKTQREKIIEFFQIRNYYTMKYQIPMELAVNKDCRKTQSANKCRGAESPNKLYQNFTHKNSSQPKVVNLFRSFIFDNFILQIILIDITNIYKLQQMFMKQTNLKNLQVLIKELRLKLINQMTLIKDFIQMRSKCFQVLIEIHRIDKVEIQKNKLNVLNKTITNKGNRLQAVKVNQGREIYDCNNSKQSSQPDLQDQILRKTNNYLRNNRNGQSTPNNIDENPQFNYFQHKIEYRNRRSNYTRSDDVTPLRRSVFQQIQDYSDTKLDQINVTKEEDIMQFSFGLQYNKLRALKRFPKDIFYGDVRKAKKNLQMQ